jgi:hypothetical protein
VYDAQPGKVGEMIVAATTDGVYEVESGDRFLGGYDVRFFAADSAESWAVVGGRSAFREAASGWREVARLDRGAALVAQPLGEARLLVGTTGAHVVRLAHGDAQRVVAFDCVPGREEWGNPAAAGRPDVWSFASDGDLVFVSVHVGGLWRSSGDLESWTNVLVPETDIHQVAAADGLIAVAAEHGFGFSYDGGDSWSWTIDGLHAAYLQCVALSHDAVYVGASSGPFADDAAVYRASPPGSRFERRSEGLPDAFASIGPYHLVADGDTVAVAAWSANTISVSHDAGTTWAPVPRSFPVIHSLAQS